MHGYSITFFNVDSDEIDYFLEEDKSITLIGFDSENKEISLFIDSSKMTLGYLFDEILPVVEYRVKKSILPCLINCCYQTRGEE